MQLLSSLFTLQISFNAIIEMMKLFFLSIADLNLFRLDGKKRRLNFPSAKSLAFFLYPFCLHVAFLKLRIQLVCCNFQGFSSVSEPKCHLKYLSLMFSIFTRLRGKSSKRNFVFFLIIYVICLLSWVHVWVSLFIKL